MCNGRFLEVHVVLKFSIIPLVFGEIHLFIRWSAHTLCVHVKREGSLTRTPPPPPPPPPSVSSRRAAGCGNEPSQWLYFCCLGKMSFCVCVQFLPIRVANGLWVVTDSNMCDVVGPRSYAFRVSRAAIYIVVRRVAQTYQTNLGFRHTSYLAPPP